MAAQEIEGLQAVLNQKELVFIPPGDLELEKIHVESSSQNWKEGDRLLVTVVPAPLP